MSLEDYNNKLETIQAIPENQLKAPNMPIDSYLQESENLNKWCQDDKEVLTNASLDWSFVEDLPARTGALRQAESNWFNLRYSQQEAQRVWKEKSPAAYELRNQILHTMHYAYRNDDALAGRISEIAEGSTHADMIQDLNDITVLGKENIAPLEAVHMDLALLDQAAAMSAELGELLGQATASREDNSAARILRDKAYTHLKEAVDEIRTCGQFVFWRDEARIKGYVSQYHKRRNRNSAPEVKEEETV